MSRKYRLRRSRSHVWLGLFSCPRSALARLLSALRRSAFGMHVVSIQLFGSEVMEVTGERGWTVGGECAGESLARRATNVVEGTAYMNDTNHAIPIGFEAGLWRAADMQHLFMHMDWRPPVESR